MTYLLFIYVILQVQEIEVITCGTRRGNQEKYERDNKIVRGHLLNHMCNSLFDLFVMHKSAKVILDLLEKKYVTDDTGKRSMLWENSYKSTWSMTNQSWNKCMCTRT